jgi:hypothetical protein
MLLAGCGGEGLGVEGALGSPPPAPPPEPPAGNTEGAEGDLRFQGDLFRGGPR